MVSSLTEGNGGEGVKPSVSSFNTLFRVLMNEEKIDKGVFLLKQMHPMGCSANFLSY